MDSGTNSLVLTTDVFSAVMDSLQELNSQFVELAETALNSETGIPSSQLDLSSRTTIHT